ncbi:MAG: shikimate kinase, partial [Myxococcota bacterium]
FVDLDERIERLFGASTPSLLAEGEAVFRSAERRALATLVAEPGFAGRDVVVATGGGTVIDPENRALMRATGTVVHLAASVDALHGRLTESEAAAPGGRPLLETGVVPLRDRLAQLLGERAAAYRDCDLEVDAGAAPEDVARRITAALAVEPNPAAGAPDSEAV